MRFSFVFGMLALVAAHAAAQSFNVDAEGFVSVSTPPSPTYGAVAARRGIWNTIATPPWASFVPLFDVDGASTSVVVQMYAFDDGVAWAPTTGMSGDEAALMDDSIEHIAQCADEFDVLGLAPGDYRVFTYSWYPCTDNHVSVSGAIEPVTLVLNPCTYPGRQIRGQTYAVHHVRALAAGQVMSIRVDPNSGCGGSTGGICNGFQIVKAPGELFCAGDGLDPAVSTPCPCGNVGANAHGCASSTNPGGAFLDASGTVAFDDVVLEGSDMPGASTCVYLQGDALVDMPFGDGVLCTGGNLVRLRVRGNVAGASAFPDASDTITLSQRGGVVPGSGVTRSYQTYYRNAAAGFCPPATFNVTNGVSLVW